MTFAPTSKPSNSRVRERAEERRRRDSRSLHYEELHKIYPGVDIATDITPATFTNVQQNAVEDRTSAAIKSIADVASFFSAFESSSPTVEGNDIRIADVRSLKDDTDVTMALSPHGGGEDGGGGGERRQVRQKKEPTVEDKAYRADREYVKRRSHQKMIWFFRHLNIRHPAAIRTHLERVKHTEFELPNLQCVYPHHDLSIACDDHVETDTTKESDRNSSRPTKNAEASVAANMNYYNIYCATPTLVERIRRMMGESKSADPDCNKKVITFVADVVGRLLWHSNRIHAVMFAKSDHLDRDCFLLYSRQVEPTPFSMRSDSFFCRRHDSEKYRSIAPQPDLTRANSARVANESSIYIVGCDVLELWDSFPYEYRVTHCRQMKPLHNHLTRLDPSLLEMVLSPLKTYVNGYREDSPYVEVAATTSFDVLSALLRDPDTRDIIADDSTLYREYLERFILVTILNVHAKLRLNVEWRMYGNTDTNQTSKKQLNNVVLHHVHYRRETRTLRNNRVYYYRNASNFICSHSLLDDRFEDRRIIDKAEITNRKPTYFYDVMQLFEYDEGAEHGNYAAMYLWVDATTMIRESAHTIGKYLTPEVIRGPPPADPFYPPSSMSSIDLAIDRMLERAIKHAKKIKLPSSPTSSRRHSKKRIVEEQPNKAGEYVPIEEDQEYVRNAIVRSLSKIGENRLKDGYTSPTHQDIETVISHNGKEVPVQIKVGSGGVPLTRVDYEAAPPVRVYEKLICAYLIDPTQPEQIRVVPGSYITDSNKQTYVQLRISDRIVRVFCIQYLEDGTYLIKPFVYLIFRNMPYTVINNELITDLFRDVMDYDDHQGFGVFDDTESRGRLPYSHYVNCNQPIQQPVALDDDLKPDPLRDVAFGSQHKNELYGACSTDDVATNEDAIESLLSTVDWGHIAV